MVPSQNLMTPDLRTPVVIFLSDGECSLSDEIMYGLCRSAVRAGYAYLIHVLDAQSHQNFRSSLSFHAVSFGMQTRAGSLRRMVQIATEIHDTAPRDPLVPFSNPCSYSEALDTVRRAE